MIKKWHINQNNSNDVRGVDETGKEIVFIETNHDIQKLYDAVKEANGLNAPYYVEILKTKQPPTNDKIKIMLNSGHSGGIGASGINKEVKEEVFTKLQTKTIKTILENTGKFIVNMIEQDIVGGLTNVGKSAEGYALALSCHFNASDKKEHGPMFLGGKNKPKSMAFGNKICERIAQEFGYKKFGFYERNVSVTSAFDKTSCPIAVLVECEFIDDETDLEAFKKDVLRQSEIVAQCIYEEFYPA
jgi:N-acetylmuramoyl-L-alanine amidase